MPHQDAPKRAGGRPVLTTALVFAALMAVIAARVAARGVITPWAPIARAAPTACPALSAAHLDQIWPPGTRKMDGKPAVFDEDGSDDSFCTWGRPDIVRPYTAKRVRAPFTRLQTRIIRYNGSLITSPLAAAIYQMKNDRQEDTASQDVSHLGDTAFSTADPADETHAKVVARRANVIVSVEATADDPGRAATAAHDLTAAILAQIELG